MMIQKRVQLTLGPLVPPVTTKYDLIRKWDQDLRIMNEFFCNKDQDSKNLDFIRNSRLNMYSFHKQVFEKIYRNLLENMVFFEDSFAKWCTSLNSSLENTDSINLHKYGIFTIISEIFEKICYAVSTLRIAFTLSTSTIADKKKYGSNIFLKSTFMTNFVKIGDSHYSHYSLKLKIFLHVILLITKMKLFQRTIGRNLIVLLKSGKKIS